MMLLGALLFPFGTKPDGYLLKHSPSWLERMLFGAAFVALSGLLWFTFHGRQH